MRKVVWLVLLFLSNSVFASTNCQQEFKLIGLDVKKDNTLYISEKKNGECSIVILHKLLIDEYGVNSTQERFHAKDSIENKFKEVNQIILSTIKINIELPLILENKDGVWQDSTGEVEIRSISASQEKISKLNNTRQLNGYIWNRQYGMRGIDSPQFENMDTRLLNYHPGGLYIDYDIEKIYFYEKYSYFLIFTKQSRYTQGMDTMHGYLLFKILSE